VQVTFIPIIPCHTSSPYYSPRYSLHYSAALWPPPSDHCGLHYGEMWTHPETVDERDENMLFKFRTVLIKIVILKNYYYILQKRIIPLINLNHIILERQIPLTKNEIWLEIGHGWPKLTEKYVLKSAITL